MAGERPGHLGDLVEGHVEHVVEHVGQPLGRREGVEHDQEGQADGVGEDRLVGRVLLRRPGDHRVGEGGADRGLRAGLAARGARRGRPG